MEEDCGNFDTSIVFSKQKTRVLEDIFLGCNCQR